MNSLTHSVFVSEPDIEVHEVQDIRDIKLEVIEPEPLQLYLTNGLARAKVENALWQMAQNVLAPQNIDRLGTAGDRDMLKIYIRKVS